MEEKLVGEQQVLEVVEEWCQEEKEMSATQVLNFFMVSSLEARWQAAWLCCLEWRCLLEQLVAEEDWGGLEGENDGENSFLKEASHPKLDNMCQNSYSDSSDSAYSSTGLSWSDLSGYTHFTKSSESKLETMCDYGCDSKDMGDSGSNVEDWCHSSDHSSDSGVSELECIRQGTPEGPGLAPTVWRHSPMTPQDSDVHKFGQVLSQRLLFHFSLFLLVLLLSLLLYEQVHCQGSVCALAVTPVLTFTQGRKPT